MPDIPDEKLVAIVDRLGDKLALAFKDLELEMVALRQDMTAEIRALRQDMTTEIRALRQDMGNQFHRIDVRLAKVESRLGWLVVTAAGVGWLLGAVLAWWAWASGQL